MADPRQLRFAVRVDNYERFISKHAILGFVSFVTHVIAVFLLPFIDRVDLLGQVIPVVALSSGGANPRLTWAGALVSFVSPGKNFILNPPLALSSAAYLIFDPLFLYALLINGATKCLVIDHKLKIFALVLRSWGDLRYLLRIYRRVKDGRWKDLNLKMLGLPGEILAVLPIPHVAILVFLPNMRGSNSLKIMWFLDFLIVLQYIPRVYPLYMLCKSWNAWNNGSKGFKLPKWSLVVVNVYGYLIASHILGALWYFFSIQRVIECWEHACRSKNGCEFSTSCVQNRHKNITFWENLCPINSPDKQVFDFGIFYGALHSSMQGSSNFFQKCLQCFCWGIRNLSSYGSNLSDTSAYVWENLFVILISISGLLLFLYLLGFVQEFMQKVDKLKTIEQRMEVYGPKIQTILSDYGLPLSDEMKLIIKLAVKGKLREDENYILENMSSILSLTQARSFATEIKCNLFLDKLKKVDGPKDKQYEKLKQICEHLEPVICSEGSYIIRQGEPLDMMFFVTRGSVLTYATNNGGSNGSLGTIQIEKENGLYGEELLTWAEGPSRKLSNLPISPFTVKCHNKVEIFALKATDDLWSSHSSTDNITVTVVD